MRHWQRWGVKLPGKGSLTESNIPEGAGLIMKNGSIALFEFENINNQISIADEKHYRLSSPNELTTEELEIYKSRTI